MICPACIAPVVYSPHPTHPTHPTHPAHPAIPAHLAHPLHPSHLAHPDMHTTCAMHRSFSLMLQIVFCRQQWCIYYLC